MAKPKTSIQKLKSLINDLEPIEGALVQERIIKIFEMTENDINENPENWERCIISPSLFLMINEKVKKHIGYEKSLIEE